MTTRAKGAPALHEKNAGLRVRLQEAEEILRAIRAGEVDALVMGEEVYGLRGADTPCRILIESMNEGAAVFAGDGSVLYANSQLADLLRTPLQDLLGSSFRTIVAASDVPAFDIMLADDLRRSGTLDVELKRDDAAGLPVQLSMRKLDWEGASAIGVVVTDLTNRKLATLAQSRVAAIVECSFDAIVGETLEGTVTTWNRSAERMFGYSSEEMIGRPISQIIPPDRKGEEERLLSRILRGDHIEPFDTVRLRKDGRDIDVSVAMSPTRDEDLRIIGASKVVRDITERKRADLEIRALNAELEQRIMQRTAELAAAIGELSISNAKIQRDAALLAGISEAQSLFISEAHPSVIFNSILDTLLGLTRSDYGFVTEVFYSADGTPNLIARAFTNIAWNDETRALYPKFLAGELRFDKLRSLYGAVMTTSAPVIANDAPNDPRRCGLPAGHPPLHSFLGVPMLLGKDLVGVIGLANAPGGYSEETVAYLAPISGACANLIAARRNEERRRQAETDLREMNARLDAANKELEAFSYSVSHDLHAPLRAIEGYSRILLEDCGDRVDDEGRRVLGVVRSETQRMAQLIDELLQFSRLTRQDMQRIETDMTALARCAFDDIVASCGRHARFELRDLPLAYGAPLMLREVWVNLLDNAVKFTAKRSDAAIEVGYGRDDAGEPAYYVRDNGVGFDMAYSDKLFGVFQRLHGEADFPGTGVGLALVHRIITRHGGRVWAEASVNEGATFYFSLPARSETETTS